MKKPEQFEKINFPKLVREVFNTTEHLYLSLPSIDKKMAETLVVAKQQRPNITIKIVIDNSEEAIRNGFGDIEGIDKLIQSNIQILESHGNLISFIIFDSIGYFLFPHSRIFMDEAKGTNAFRIDPSSILLLKKHFFLNENSTDKFELTAIVGDSNKYFLEAFDEIENTQIQEQQFVSDFDTKKHEENKKKLKVNPPLEPDLRRQINIYNAKIQFVELNFSGGNLENKITQLPEKALPVNSTELKSLIQTRIKMFQDIKNNPDYKILIDYRKKIEKLRKDYLKPITCRPGKSILEIDKKEMFLNELNVLKGESENLNKSLTTMLEKGKLDTLDLLKGELYKFFHANQPVELKYIDDSKTKERMLENIINEIVASVKFPDVSKLIKKISLTELFYDLTWNDFRDTKLHKEFMDKKIMTTDDINTIVNLKDAFETKRIGRLNHNI